VPASASRRLNRRAQTDPTGPEWLVSPVDDRPSDRLKDPQEAFSPRQLSNGIDDFVGAATRRGYINKLRSKVDDVTSDPSAVATALGVDEPSREWTVRAAMVTRRPVAAAFANTGVPFATIEELAELIRNCSAGGDPQGSAVGAGESSGLHREFESAAGRSDTDAAGGLSVIRSQPQI